MIRTQIYHEAIGEELNATVAEIGRSEFEVSEVAGEGSSDEGHEVVDDINDDCRSCKEK